MMSRKALVGIAVLIALVLATSAQASLTPVHDAMAWDLAGETGIPHNWDTLWISNNPGSAFNSYLMFDVGSQLLPGETVLDAELDLYCFGWSGSGANVDLRRANNSAWDETTLTWNNQPGFGGVVDSIVVGAVPQWYTWDDVPLSWFDALDAGGYLSIALTTPYGTGYTYGASDEHTSGYGPRLRITQTHSTAVPEPTSIALLALATGGIGATLRKRRRK